MGEIITGDGLLTRHLDGNGLALVFDVHVIGEDRVEILTAHTPDSESGLDDEQAIGRSALGINGVDIRQSAAAFRVNGSVYVPIDAEAHTDLGSGLLSRLYDLAGGHEPGQALEHDGHKLAFGRLLRRSDLVQLNGLEIGAALSQNLIAVDTSGNQTDVSIVGDTLSLPLAPWQIVPKGNIAGNLDLLMTMLRDGQSARAFMFEHTDPEYRDAHLIMSKFVVGSVVFSPGPYFGEVVEAVSQVGNLPQLQSAAWLDQNRSGGLNYNHQPGLRGRQVEVVNTDPESFHPWGEARVAIKLYKPGPTADQRYMEQWSSLDNTQRLRLHFSGYGGV